MKREELQRMLSQVDEKYISEITESETTSEIEYADEVSGEVEVVTHISHWRNWAAAAAALLFCIGLGSFLIRPAIQRSQFEVADSAGCYDFIDSLTEETLDNYFLNEIENLPDFPFGTPSFTSSFGDIDSVIGKNLFNTMKVSFSEMHECAEISMVNSGTGIVIARVWDNPSESDFSQAKAYHIDDYDVDFYGAFLDANTEPMPVSHSIFSYHGKMYYLYADTLSKKETIRLVYEILDSDFSAKQLYLEYGMSDEDFIPYFTYAKPDVSNLDYYDETVLSEQYGDAYENSVDNIAPPVAEKYFSEAERLFLNSGTGKSAKFNMSNPEHSLVLSIYDNPQIDMNTFTTLTPCHLDDYNIDFYGLYKYHDGNPIQNSTMGIFQYHDKLYILNVTNFTRQETMKLVYEILDSDISAESLYQQYCGDIVHMEDSRIITLEDANELEFCKGMIPQLDTLMGENEQINHRNLGMDGEYVYDNLYDDSDLLLDKDSLNYHQNEDGEQLSYSYSNPECYLHIIYTSFLPDNVNLAEHYSPKVTLQYPFSTPVKGQDENSRLRKWDFWLDLGTCYIGLDGYCSMNQEDAFINGLNHILVLQSQTQYEYETTLMQMNQLDFCKNLIPQMTEVNDMKFDSSIDASSAVPEERAYIVLYYWNEARDKGFSADFSNLNIDLMDVAVPVFTADRLTEEELLKAGVSAEYKGFIIQHKKGIINIALNCEIADMMPWITELKSLLETYDSENTDLQQFNQNELWGGLVPEIQKIGNLEFQGITPVSPDDVDALNYQVLYQEKNNPEHQITVIYSESYPVQTEATPLMIEELDGNLQIESGQYEHFELLIDCHGYYVQITGENCDKEELDSYTMALSENYKSSH